MEPEASLKFQQISVTGPHAQPDIYNPVFLSYLLQIDFKHVPAAKNTQATIELLMKTRCFFVVCVKMLFFIII
jgi:hypothetical protein